MFIYWPSCVCLSCAFYACGGKGCPFKWILKIVIFSQCALWHSLSLSLALSLSLSLSLPLSFWPKAGGWRPVSGSALYILTHWMWADSLLSLSQSNRTGEGCKAHTVLGYPPLPAGRIQGTLMTFLPSCIHGYTVSSDGHGWPLLLQGILHDGLDTILVSTSTGDPLHKVYTWALCTSNNKPPQACCHQPRIPLSEGMAYLFGNSR